ncbi:MAG: hypothetical protein KBT34_09870 [Prevotella sp.]|nr:hypothetical protein [Candidatus Prevotella equi]
MANMEKMMDIVCAEIEKIAEKGLTTQNLETAYKLIDMMKDLKTVEGMEEYSDGESGARGRYARRDAMGRYARRYDGGNSYNDGMNGYEQRYMQSKRAYRNDHSMAAKQDMLQDLDDFMQDMHGKLKELKRDADTPEERETIERYMKMLERV